MQARFVFLEKEGFWMCVWVDGREEGGREGGREGM